MSLFDLIKNFFESMKTFPLWLSQLLWIVIIIVCLPLIVAGVKALIRFIYWLINSFKTR